MPLVIPAQFNIARHFIDVPGETHPERVAILGEPAPVTYGELRRQVSRVGNALRGLGCAVGDRVLIVLPDSVEFVAAFFGTTKIGSVAVPVNSMTRAGDYSYYLADSGARIAIVHASVLGEILSTNESETLEHLVVVGDLPENVEAPARVRKWGEWLAAADDEWEAQETLCTAPAFFLYTSGSGGTPKAAIHQHKDMLVTSTSFAHGVLGLRPDDRTFSVSKLFFAYGLGGGMYFSLSVGACTVLNPERPRAERILELVRRHRPTVFFAVPTVYALILREVDAGLAADFSSVRLAVSAGEALPAEIFEQYRRRFGIDIIDAIGSTEMLHMFISNRPGEARAGSCGVEVPNYEAQIVDDKGLAVTRGEIGNLWVRGESAFAGYWNKPELTERTQRGEWVVTGDKFFCDPDGYYHYCGRSDDMLKVAGMWVAPGEVENALLGHAAVAEAALVGATDGTGLIKPVGFVVLRAGVLASGILADEIRAHVRRVLPSYKCPQEIRFLEELPKTPTGKIQRFRLRDGLAR